MDLAGILKSLRVDTFVCGGISRETRDSLRANGIVVMNNVACSAEEILAALESGSLRPGFGLSSGRGRAASRAAGAGSGPSGTSREVISANERGADCLACLDRTCLTGASCPLSENLSGLSDSRDVLRVLEAASDVSHETDRQLCRLAELVYFCLDLDYTKIGLAFCVELLEPTHILASVLRRFFEVTPVCCKVGGRILEEEGGLGGPSIHYDPEVACNPLGQAEILNGLSTDLNVIVGLCMGVDSVFARASEAPVTTLFVKDRSLANNPIGALYSEYYLQESLAPSASRARRMGRHAQQHQRPDRSRDRLPMGVGGKEES